MLHIILLILKITGIILLCILGVILLAVCCVLFVPVRYRIEICREEGEDKPPFVVKAKVTWLLHLVNVLLCYPADVYVRVRLMLFTLFKIPETEKERNRTSKKKKRKGDKEEGEPSVSERDAGSAGTPKEAEAKEHTDRDSAADHSAAEELEVSAESEHSEEAADSEESSSTSPEGPIRKLIRKIRGLFYRIRQFLEKIKSAVQKIRYTIRSMCDKIKSTSDTVQYYKEVLESDAFRHSWELCRGQAAVVLKALKPDKFEADLIVGTGNPASTGDILAWHGMLYPLIGPHVRVVGDFERAHLEGYVFIRGKIRTFTFLRVAWKVYRNKDIRTLIRLFKKEAV